MFFSLVREFDFWKRGFFFLSWELEGLDWEVSLNFFLGGLMVVVVVMFLSFFLVLCVLRFSPQIVRCFLCTSTRRPRPARKDSRFPRYHRREQWERAECRELLADRESGLKCCLLRLRGRRVSVICLMARRILGDFFFWRIGSRITASDFFDVVEDEVHQLIVAFEGSGDCDENGNR